MKSASACLSNPKDETSASHATGTPFALTFAFAGSFGGPVCRFSFLLFLYRFLIRFGRFRSFR